LAAISYKSSILIRITSTRNSAPNTREVTFVQVII
jgi:hypothetical protein